MKFETLLKQYMDRPIKESYDEVFNKPTSKYASMNVLDIIRSMKVLKESKGDMTELVEYLDEQNEVVEEFWRGAGAVGKKALGALGGAAKRVGSAALGAANRAATATGNAAMRVGNAALEKGKQAASRANAAYQKAEDEGRQIRGYKQDANRNLKDAKNMETQMAKASKLLKNIYALYTNAIQSNYIADPGKPLEQVGLGQIVTDFEAAITQRRISATDAKLKASGVGKPAPATNPQDNDYDPATDDDALFA